MARRWILCLILIFTLLSGCIGEEKPAESRTNQTPAGSPTPVFTVPEPSTVYIEIKGQNFDSLEKKVVKGTTVRWTNMDSAQYILTVDNHSSPPLNKRDTWNYTFNRNGTFVYNISSHPSIRPGRITVE